jgi:hypothetical protein
MSEVKPAMESYITVAEFQIARDVTLVDCTLPEGDIWNEQDYFTCNGNDRLG